MKLRKNGIRLIHHWEIVQWSRVLCQHQVFKLLYISKGVQIQRLWPLFLPTSSQTPRAGVFEFSGYGRFFLPTSAQTPRAVFLNSAAMAAFLTSAKFQCDVSCWLWNNTFELATWKNRCPVNILHETIDLNCEKNRGLHLDFFLRRTKAYYFQVSSTNQHQRWDCYSNILQLCRCPCLHHDASKGFRCISYDVVFLVVSEKPQIWKELRLCIACGLGYRVLTPRSDSSSPIPLQHHELQH